MSAKRMIALLICLLLLQSVVVYAVSSDSEETTEAEPTIWDYSNMGPLLEGISADMATNFTTFTSDVSLFTEEELKGESVSITDSTGTLIGTKTVTDTGTTDSNGNPIYKIELKASVTSDVTGESCDFVLVLDMSYSMTGDNLTALKNACTNFVQELYAASKFSRVAIVTYGGDKNANDNLFYIRSTETAESDSWYLTVDPNREVGNTGESNLVTVRSYSSLPSGTNVNAKKWYIEKSGNYWTIKSAYNGQYLTTSKTANSVGNYFVITADYQTSSTGNQLSKQMWKLLEDRHGSYTIQTGLVVSGTRTEQVLKRNSNSNNTFVLLTDDPNSPATRPAYDDDTTKTMNLYRWYLEPATDPDYETYYWTNSDNEQGYGYYTDNTYADKALLTVSQDDGDAINQKLLDAIDALEVYGEADEGTCPGEAFEKAARIYQAVKLDDTNDYCTTTGEFYYNAKRGVLYFADGAPAPSDGIEMDYYPSHDATALTYYGKLYSFLRTYRDIQDALNWSLVLKYDRGKVVSETYTGYSDSGEPNQEMETFNISYVNSYSRHEYSEYALDSDGLVMGLGATVYTLGVNLPAIDVTGECTLDHAEHKYVSIPMADDTTVQVCIHAVGGGQYDYADYNDGNERNGFYNSLDSRTNEYFYRLSSHRQDGTHVSYGDPANRTEAETAWNEAFGTINRTWSDGTVYAQYRGWNGRYPDFLCRNQQESYYVSCDDQDAILQAFKGVALQTAKVLKSLTMVDNITEYFEICDANGNPLPVGTVITMNGLTGTIAINDKGNQCVIWEPFDLNPGDGSGEGAQEFDFSFTVRPKSEFFGGNGVQTNDGAFLYDPDGNSMLTYPDPDVDVPLHVGFGIADSFNCYLGSSLLQEITLSSFGNFVGMSINGVDLDMTDVDHAYGVDWQDDYVSVRVELADADGNVVGSFADVRQDVQYKVKATVTPLLEGDITEAEVFWSDTAYICVFYPEFTFTDGCYFYGDAILDVDLTSHMSVLWWNDLQGRYAGMGAIMSERYAPAYTLSFATAYTGLFTKQDLRVDMSVSTIGYIEGDLSGLCKYAWNSCSSRSYDHAIATHTGDADLAEFWLHPNTGTLTVSKIGGVATEPYVFTVYRDGEKYTEVTVMGDSSVTLYELPSGTYTIVEDGNWSWRYEGENLDSGITLGSDNAAGMLRCKNTEVSNRWFNGFSAVVENIFGIDAVPANKED